MVFDDYTVCNLYKEPPAIKLIFVTIAGLPLPLKNIYKTRGAADVVCLCGWFVARQSPTSAYGHILYSLKPSNG